MNDNCDYQKLYDFLNSYSDRLGKYQKDKEARQRKDNNLFSSISDAYKNENYNSDIIRFILDPTERGMGSDEFLKKIVKFIELGEDASKALLSDLSKIVVTREENRIDISIKNTVTKKAIIIESKINNAGDQPMQLFRYYQKMKNAGYEVLKIVYLTRTQKNPDLKIVKEKKYDIKEKDYEEFMDLIPSLLFKTFISNEKPNKEYHKFQDFLKGFQKSDIINQYIKLLEKIGEESYMKEKELIKDVFNNKKNLEAIKGFADIYNNYKEVIAKILEEQGFVKKLEENGWNKDNSECIYKKKSCIEKLEMYFCPVYSKRYGFWVEIGFHSTENKSKNSRFEQKFDAMKKIIEDIADKYKIDTQSGIHAIYSDWPWLCIQFAYNETKTLDEYFKTIKKMIEQLEKEAFGVLIK